MSYEVKLGLERPEFRFDPSFHLTPTEEQVGRLLCYARSNKQIGEILGMSAKTARNCVERVMQKLDVHSRHDVIEKAKRT